MNLGILGGMLFLVYILFTFITYNQLQNFEHYAIYNTYLSHNKIIDNKLFATLSYIIYYSSIKEVLILIPQILFLIFYKRLNINYIMISYLNLGSILILQLIFKSARPFWEIKDLNFNINLCSIEYALPTSQISIFSFTFLWFFLCVFSKQNTTFESKVDKEDIDDLNEHEYLFNNKNEDCEKSNIHDKILIKLDSDSSSTNSNESKTEINKQSRLSKTKNDSYFLKDNSIESSLLHNKNSVQLKNNNKSSSIWNKQKIKKNRKTSYNNSMNKYKKNFNKIHFGGSLNIKKLDVKKKSADITDKKKENDNKLGYNYIIRTLNVYIRGAILFFWFLLASGSSFISIFNLQDYVYQIVFSIVWTLASICFFIHIMNDFNDFSLLFLKNNQRLFRKIKIYTFLIIIGFNLFIIILLSQIENSSMNFHSMELFKIEVCSFKYLFFGLRKNYINFSLSFGLIGALSGIKFQYINNFNDYSSCESKSSKSDLSVEENQSINNIKVEDCYSKNVDKKSINYLTDSNTNTFSNENSSKENKISNDNHLESKDLADQSFAEKLKSSYILANTENNNLSSDYHKYILNSLTSNKYMDTDKNEYKDNMSIDSSDSNFKEKKGKRMKQKFLYFIKCVFLSILILCLVISHFYIRNQIMKFQKINIIYALSSITTFLVTYLVSYIISKYILIL